MAKTLRSWTAMAAAVGLALCAAGAQAEPVAKTAMVSETPGLSPPSPDLTDAAFDQSAGGDELSAIAVATGDEDWGKRWAKSGKPLPIFKQARVVEVGQKISVLVFVTSRPNAPAIESAKGAMEFAVDIYKPDGKLQERLGGNACMKKGQKMEPGSMALCEGMVSFELDPEDPKGQWVFKVSMAVPGQKPLVFGTSFEAF